MRCVDLGGVLKRGAPVHPHGLVEQPLGGGDGGRRTLAGGGGAELDRPFERGAVVGELIGEAELDRARTVDPLRIEQQSAGNVPGYASGQKGQNQRRHVTDGDLGVGESRARLGNNQVACGRKSAAAADGSAVDRCDGEAAVVEQHLEEAAKRGGVLSQSVGIAARCNLVERRQVGAGGEVASGAGQHDGANPLLGSGGDERSGQIVDYGPRQRVGALGVVERQDANGSTVVYQHRSYHERHRTTGVTMLAFAAMGRVHVTVGFLVHLGRDLLGTLRARIRRTFDWVVYGVDEIVVGVDVFPFAETMTGVGWYEWNLLAALDRRDDGIRYNLYAETFLAPGEQPPPVPGSRSMRLRAHEIPAGFLLPVGPTLWLLRHVVEPLLCFLDGNDVFFAPNFFPPPRRRFTGRRLVITVHDLAFVVAPEMVAPATLADLEANFPRALARAERIIAVSEATAGDLQEHLGVDRSRVHTIHEGLDPRFADAATGAGADPGLPDDYLLFVSTIEPRKNVVGVLRAFALVVEWGYSGHLVVVGRWGWRTDAIRAEWESSPVRHRIIHLDYVDRDRLASVYAGARALLFPSWIEGFGLPLLESMACGTPVVTSGRSAMPEVAGPAGVYVDPSSAHAIATGAASLIDDADHHARLQRIGRERALRFSWDDAAAATAAVFRRAAGGRVDGPAEYRV